MTQNVLTIWSGCNRQFSIKLDGGLAHQFHRPPRRIQIRLSISWRFFSLALRYRLDGSTIFEGIVMRAISRRSDQTLARSPSGVSIILDTCQALKGTGVRPSTDNSTFLSFRQMNGWAVISSKITRHCTGLHRNVFCVYPFLPVQHHESVRAVSLKLLFVVKMCRASPCGAMKHVPVLLLVQLFICCSRASMFSSICKTALCVQKGLFFCLLKSSLRSRLLAFYERLLILPSFWQTHRPLRYSSAHSSASF